MIEARIAIYATLATVLIGLVSAILGMHHQNSKMDHITILVNSQYKDVKDYVKLLVAALRANGIDVPDDPSES